MPRTVSLLLLLSLIGAGIVAWRSGAAAGTRGASSVAPANAPAPADGSDARLAARGLAPERAEGDAATRTAVPRSPAARTDAVRPGLVVELRIVAADGALVPGAEVWHLGERDLHGRARRRAIADAREAEHVLTTFGAALRADGAGSVLVPAGEPGYVCAAAPGLWGWRALDGAADAELALAPDPPLRVRVVDTAGAPMAGVAVGVQAGARPSELLGAAWTDADGRAALAHARRLVAPQRKAFVALAAAVPEPPHHRLDLEAWPEDEVELVLPPTGALEVRVVASLHGAPLDLGGELSLSAEGPGWSAGPFRLEHGVARVGHVAPGVALGLRVRFFDGRADAFVTADGPRAPAELALVEIPVEDDPAAIALRAVGPDDAPLARQRVDLQLVTERERHRAPTTSRWTDDDGRLRWVVAPALADGPRAIQLTAIVDGAPLEGGVAIPSGLGAGEHDLDVVVLRAVPPLAAGRVVDVAGRPIEGATVLARSVAWTEIDGELRERRATLQSGRATTDAAGRFFLRAGPACERVELRAQGIGWAAGEPVVVAPGAWGVELALAEEAAIAGRVLLAAEARPVLLQVVAERTSDGSAFARAAELRLDRSFGLPELPPGLYDVRVVRRTDGQILATVPGVLATREGSAPDPRLDPLDLRERLRFLRIRVRDPDGRDATDLRAWQRPAGSGAPWSELTHTGDGEAQVVTAEPALDLLLVAAGMERVQLDRVAATRDVVLPWGAPLELVLADGLPDLPPGMGIVAQAREPAPGPGRAVSRSAEVDAHGVGRLAVAEGAALTLELRLRTGAVGWGPSLGCTPARYVVPPGGGRVVVKLDAEALRETLARY